MMDNYEITAEIRQAMADIAERYKNVVKDTSRPGYHFASPSKMLSDVWGGIYSGGYYHLFYDINHRDDMERQCGAFGHLRSVNMLEWEDMPLALLPQYDRGEIQLNDGTVVVTPGGEPLMYYTRVYEDSDINRDHVAVRGSSDLIHWERLNGGEAILTMENHGGPVFGRFWSDPIIFSDSGRTFMIISKCNSAQFGDMIPIYEATDDTWLKWEYRGAFADHTGEVLNFIKIKDKWVLIYSPYNNPKYFVGTFDSENCRFICEKEAVLSYGYINQGIVDDISRGFYATNSFYGKNGEVYIIGWLSGFVNPKGWDGCVSLIRTLELDENCNLLMKPAPVLDELRADKLTSDSAGSVKCGRCFEIDAEFDLTDNKLEISVEDSFTLEIGDGRIRFNDIEFDYAYGKCLKVKMYVDVSVAEIFFDEGRISLSRCFNEICSDSLLTVNSTAGIIKFDVYKLKEIYK